MVTGELVIYYMRKGLDQLELILFQEITMSTPFIKKERLENKE